MYVSQKWSSTHVLRNATAIAVLALAGCGRESPLADSAKGTPHSMRQSSDAAAPTEPVVVPAPDKISSQMDAREAEQLIASARSFRVDLVEYQRTPSREAVAFNLLLEQDDATVHFDRLARGPIVASGLYALCAFQVMDQARFAALQATLEGQRATVETDIGGVHRSLEINDAVAMVVRDNWGHRLRAASTRLTGARIAELVLFDGSGLWGYREMYLGSDGACIVRFVRPPKPGESGMKERRTQVQMSAAVLDEIQDLLERHNFLALEMTRRPGLPDEEHSSIRVQTTLGQKHGVVKWISDVNHDFDAIHEHLVRLSDRVLEETPIYEGEAVYRWKPIGFE